MELLWLFRMHKPWSKKSGLANVEVPIMSFLKTVLGYRISDRIYHAYQLFDIFKNEKIS